MKDTEEEVDLNIDATAAPVVSSPVQPQFYESDGTVEPLDDLLDYRIGVEYALSLTDR